MELNNMSETSMNFEQTAQDLKMTIEMNKSLEFEINEYMWVMEDSLAKIKARRQVIADNLKEIEEFKTKLEGYEALQ